MSSALVNELEVRFLRYVKIDTTADPTSPTSPSTPQYGNMRYWLEDDMRPVELARMACRQAGVEPFSVPVRGGTDGSRLTELGVPTPNVFTGMQEIHGPLEWVSLQDMAAATEVCIELVQLWAAAGPVDPKPEHGPESPADTGAAVDWTDAMEHRLSGG